MNDIELKAMTARCLNSTSMVDTLEARIDLVLYKLLKRPCNVDDEHTVSVSVEAKTSFGYTWSNAAFWLPHEEWRMAAWIRRTRQRYMQYGQKTELHFWR